MLGKGWPFIIEIINPCLIEQNINEVIRYTEDEVNNGPYRNFV